MSPKYNKDAELHQGQIGYCCTGQKSVRDAKIGDTIIKLEGTQNLASVQELAINAQEIRKGDYSSLVPYAVQ